MRGQTFLAGTFILAFSNLIVKLLGSIFRIPLGNLIESDGLAYYQTAYPVYIFILAISTTGFPVAISKMVSERAKLEDHRAANKVFKVSILTLFIVGILTAAIFYFGSDVIAGLLKNKKASPSIKSLSLALLVVPIVSGFKGYFQGLNDMKPTSLANFFEQLIRVIIGLYLAKTLLVKGKEIAAAGASFGASAGGLIALVVVIIIYLKKLPDLKKDFKISKKVYDEDTIKILQNLLMIAFPIIIGSLITPMMNMVDAAIVKDRLMAGGFSEREALTLYGQYSGMVATVINLPLALTMSISTAIIPAISQNFVIKNMKEVRKNIVLGTRLSNLISTPCMIGIMVLSTQVMHLLYPKEPASIGGILFISAISISLSSLLQTYTATLQALGRAEIPVINLFISSIFKIIITYIAVAIPVINVKGAAIGTLTTYTIALVLNYKAIKKLTHANIVKEISFIKPAFMSLVMGVFVYLSYFITSKFIPSGNLNTLIAILVGGIVYMYQLFYTGGIHRQELEQSSFGKKISKILYRN